MSVVDEDTARAVDAGRETLAGVLAGVQRELKKVFAVFVVTFLASVLALRWYVWAYLEANVKSQMDAAVAEEVDIIARTPFDVILMQLKIGLIVGLVVATVVGLYLARRTIVARVEESVEVTAPRLYGFVLVSMALAVGGIAYAYGVFFPLMFKILAEQAHNAGAKPSYGIVRFTEFLLLLTISFAMAAQLPLLMGVLSYAEVIPYETFRDKWRHAVVGIFVFGAVFSPPDPFTQIMWAIPLLVLYAFSLGVSKVVTNVHRAGLRGSPVEPGTFRWKGYQVLAVALLVGAGTAAALWSGHLETYLEPALAALPDRISLPYLSDVAVPKSVVRGDPVDWAWAGARAGLLAGGLAATYHLVGVLRMPVIPREFAPGAGDPTELDLGELDAAAIRVAPPEAFAALSEEEAVDLAGEAIEAGDEERGRLLLERWDEVDSSPSHATGDPAEVDFGALDAAGVRDAPDEAFAALSEDEAVELAGDAMEAGAEEKGRVLLRRFDEVQAAGAEGDGEGAPGDGESPADDPEDPVETGILGGTASGVLDAFSSEERDEDDIGGYLYDVGFVLDSLRSRAFVIFAVFVGTFTAAFAYLYTVGIEQIMAVFVSRVPNELLEPDQRVEGATDVVIALHPVEVLIFIVKFSGLLAIMVTLPLVLYYGWPALQQRGLAPGRGDRRVFLLWGSILIAGTLAGAAVGFFLIAPYVISYLVTDAIQAGMVVSYRIRSLLWVVFFMTIGFGFFLNVPIGMALLHWADLVPFDVMRRYWRHVVLGIFVVAALVTPGGVLTMLVFAVPVSVAYLLGLALLWLLTAPGRFLRGRRQAQAG